MREWATNNRLWLQWFLMFGVFHVYFLNSIRPHHTTPLRLENGGFTLKRVKSCFPSTSHFDLYLRKTRSWKSLIILTPSFSKSFVLKMLSVHTKPKSRHSQIPSGLRSVLEKLLFHDGLAWTVDLTEEIKLHFQISLFQKSVLVVK